LEHQNLQMFQVRGEA